MFVEFLTLVDTSGDSSDDGEEVRQVILYLGVRQKAEDKISKLLRAPIKTSADSFLLQLFEKILLRWKKLSSSFSIIRKNHSQSLKREIKVKGGQLLYSTVSFDLSSDSSALIFELTQISFIRRSEG